MRAAPCPPPGSATGTWSRCERSWRSMCRRCARAQSCALLHDPTDMLNIDLNYTHILSNSNFYCMNGDN